MRTFAAFAVAFALTLPAVGCGDELACTDLYAYGLNIQVTDAANGQAVCTATVTAVDGTYRETLMRFSADPPCTYLGAGERAGTYQITATATASGFKTQPATSVTVTADECHVIGVMRTIALERQ